MSKQEIEFIPGLNFQPPREGSPDFVLWRGWIKNAELIAHLQDRLARGEESTNFDLKLSKGGKPYAQANNWKPNKDGDRPQRQAPAQTASPASAQTSAFPDDDIPF